MNLSEINTNCIEGRLLMAALAALTVSPMIHINKKELDGRKMQPDEVLNDVLEVSEYMYKDNPLPQNSEAEKVGFLTALEGLINSYSKENDSDTPDFILSGFLNSCLIAYGETVKARDKWFGVDMWDKFSTEAKENDK